MLEPISKYYFDGKRFILKSRWPKRIRAVLSLAFMVFSISFANNTAHSFYTKSYSDWRIEYVQFIKASNTNLSHSDALAITNSILKWSNKFNIDEKLLLAIIKVESNFNIHAISTSGALGLMQVIPVWHKEKFFEARKVLGNPEPFNINTNIWMGTKILSTCIDQTKGINKALLCYAGQTPGYDTKVIAEFNKLKRL